MSKIHLIGNAHLDPVWLWRWQDGFSEVLQTFRSALDRMKDFPDFTFTSACCVYYQWIEKVDPEMFAEIQQRVKEGRWEIVGGWFLQPDCNMPDGESFARHALVSQRWFAEKFGITVKTGYNVDSFGHNAGLPKILKASGMDNYIFMRPMPHEKDIKESLFAWESDDGSQVTTYRIPWFYNYDTSRMECFQNLKDKAEEENMDYMAFYGVGNHGGGPTIKLIDEMHKLGIPDMEYSTCQKYFDSVDKENLPVVKDDLQHHARGCYTAESFVKRMNRKCENNLLAAEKFCVMAKELVGMAYPHDALNKGWKNVMFNQFHDILCGCSIKKAYEDAGYLYGETMSITEQVINMALQTISWNINTLQGEELPAYKEPKKWKIWEHEVLGTPIVVFNPHAWTVRESVQVNANAKMITDDGGCEIPFQMVRGDQTNNDDLYHSAFIAEVPAMGYRVYRLFAEKESDKTFTGELCAKENSLENSRVAVEFDETTGDIAKMYDKTSGNYIINKPCRAVLLDETDCDTWAHDKVQLGETVGQFGEPEFQVIEKGNVRATLRVVTKYGASTLTRDYTLIPGSNVLKVHAKVDFHEKHKTLKFTFPMEESVTAKIPYGKITRYGETGEEPCGNWINSGNLYVANDSKYGYDTENGEMRLSVIRSAIYADHCGERDQFCEYMEQGESEFTYSVFYASSTADAEKVAAELNFAQRVVMGSFRSGKLPEKLSGLRVDNDDVLVYAVKEKEDGDANIVRICEMNGKEGSASLELFGKKIDANIKHNQLKTLTDDGRELNLIEW
ncbi:MAG: glycoside hydrolase family 38 C-terminal domain-containing protein [Clostridia bacterium]|nr:glycoside hydrolase family 38 C-terminal domain-containing protein [Clostridia bacterium]